MSEIKLLPCPFCGGEAEFYRTPVKTNVVWCDSVVVRCKNCEARTNMVLYDAKKHPNDEEYDEAAAAWNTRKPLEQIEQRLKTEEMEIEDAIQSLYIEMYRNEDALKKVRELRKQTIFLYGLRKMIKEESGLE